MDQEKNTEVTQSRYVRTRSAPDICVNGNIRLMAPPFRRAMANTNEYKNNVKVYIMENFEQGQPETDTDAVTYPISFKSSGSKKNRRRKVVQPTEELILSSDQSEFNHSVLLMVFCLLIATLIALVVSLLMEKR